MNFRISKRVFYNALSVVSRAISANSPLPWLSGIKIEAKKDELVLTGSDSDVSIQKVIKADRNDFLEAVAKKVDIVFTIEESNRDEIPDYIRRFICSMKTL